MIIFKAFLVSFAILWRYLLVLPLLLVLLVIFGIVSVVISALLGLFAPFLSLVFAMAFGVASGIVAVMVGLRIGLQSYHVRPRNSYAGLIGPAVGYGMFEALLVLLMLAATIAVLIAATPLDIDQLLEMTGPTDTDVLANLYEYNTALAVVVSCIAGGIVAALRSALMVPLAGAAIGQDPGGRSHTPFYGFGQGFGALFPLVLISQVGVFLSVPFVIWIAGPLGIWDSIAETQADTAGRLLEGRDAYMPYALDVGIMAAMYLGLALYFFSLQCAGAVLVYLREIEDGTQRAPEQPRMQEPQPEQEPMRETDMMALMRSRMPKKHDE